MTEKSLIKADDINAVEIFVNGEYSKLLQFIKDEATIEKPDASTVAGRKLIRSMAARVASSKVFVEKVGKALADSEREKIEKTLSSINSSRNFVKDALIFHQAVVREPLTKWEAEKKAKEEAEALRLEIENLKVEAFEDNRAFDEKKEVADEKERLAEDRRQLEADERAKKKAEDDQAEKQRLSLKRQADAEAETERLRLKGIADAKQAEIDKAKAVEDERLRVQAVADQKEADRLFSVEQEREAEEKRASDIKHQQVINREALADMVEVVSKAIKEEEEEGNVPMSNKSLAMGILKEIIRGKVSNISVNY